MSKGALHRTRRCLNIWIWGNFIFYVHPQKYCTEVCICKCFLILQIDRVYLSSSDKIAILDHERKRTFVVHKEGLPDVGKLLLVPFKKFKLTISYIDGMHHIEQYKMILIRCFGFHQVVWNPWERKSKSMADFGDEEYKHMLCVDGAAIEKPITLKPGEEWTGRLELSLVHSSWWKWFKFKVLRRLNKLFQFWKW